MKSALATPGDVDPALEEDFERVVRAPAPESEEVLYPMPQPETLAELPAVEWAVVVTAS